MEGGPWSSRWAGSEGGEKGVDIARDESFEFIEPLFDWIKSWLVAQMPFAKQCRLISLLLHGFAQSPLGKGKSYFPMAFGSNDTFNAADIAPSLGPPGWGNKQRHWNENRCISLHLPQGHRGEGS